MTPQVIHARVAAILAHIPNRPIPAGDISVTWSPKLDLITTVNRTDSTVASGLVGPDGIIGTAEAVWKAGRQREVRILWTQRADTLLRLNVRFEAAVIHLTTVRDTAIHAPSLPWAIADHGMEDQLVPLLEIVCGDTRQHPLAIYRPRQAQWDNIAVACRKKQGATLVTETAPDGGRVFWTITADGALVRLTRDGDPGFERRPLETTKREADYVRLRELWEP